MSLTFQIVQSCTQTKYPHAHVSVANSTEGKSIPLSKWSPFSNTASVSDTFTSSPTLQTYHGSYSAADCLEVSVIKKFLCIRLIFIIFFSEFLFSGRSYWIHLA